MKVINAPKIHSDKQKSHSSLPDIVGQQKEASAQTGSHCTGSEYLNLSQERNKASFLYYQSSGEDPNLNNKFKLKWNLNQENNLKFTPHRLEVIT